MSDHDVKNPERTAETRVGVIHGSPSGGRSECHSGARAPAGGRITLGSVTRRALTLDAAVALLVLGLTLVMLQGGGFGASSHGNRPLDALGASLATASAAPLVARRVAPLTTYLLACAGSLALAALHYPLDLPFAPLVGAYFLASAYGGAARRIRRWTALAAASLFVPAIAAIIAIGWDVRAGIGLEMLFWALLFAGAWIAGDRARLRRAQLMELEHRAQQARREAERERRLAAAEERTRIARELHDSAGHAINVILVQAGAARLLHERDPDRSKRAIATIEQVAQDTIGEIDRLVRVLREDEGDHPAPANPAAIEELLERHRAAGLSLRAELNGPRHALPRSVAWAAYRILQEALTNAARHGAGSATVNVCFQPGAVDITVTNPTLPGGPAPGGPALGGGHGIVGMRERATLLGGELEASASDGVFRLHARLPYGAAAP
jgi:signal transduction histidine kinase